MQTSLSLHKDTTRIIAVLNRQLMDATGSMASLPIGQVVDMLAMYWAAAGNDDTVDYQAKLLEHRVLIEDEDGILQRVDEYLRHHAPAS